MIAYQVTLVNGAVQRASALRLEQPIDGDDDDHGAVFVTDLNGVESAWPPSAIVGVALLRDYEEPRVPIGIIVGDDG